MSAVTATESSVLEAAERLRPELSDRRREIDELRQLPQDLADQLAEMGFYRLVVPESLGGLGISPSIFCQLCETLAKANGSTAWCIFIGATSQYLFGALPQTQLQRMLENPNVITSGVFADSGTALFEERDGKPGYLINGHWRWGSGCRNAEWISGGIHEVDAQGETIVGASPLTRVFFRPEEIDIADNWHVSGMRGSGSSDYLATNVWVPSERMAGNVEDGDHASQPIYQFPKFALLGIPIGAICLGMARACLDEVIGAAKEKTPQGSRRPLSARPSLHIAVAEADAALSAGSRLLLSDDRRWLGCGANGSRQPGGSAQHAYRQCACGQHRHQGDRSDVSADGRHVCLRDLMFATALSRCPCGGSPHDGWRTRDGTGRACDARSG